MHSPMHWSPRNEETMMKTISLFAGLFVTAVLAASSAQSDDPYAKALADYTSVKTP